MTMVVNVSGQRLKIGGHSIGPREMADVNMPDSKLKDHLFVRAKMLEVSGGSVSAPKRAKPAKQDDSE